MGRTRDKVVQRVHGSRKYTNPKWEYIYSSESPTMELLAKHWKGIKGCSARNLNYRCSAEGWSKLRKKYREQMERETMVMLAKQEADERTRQIADARKTHFKAGTLLMGLGVACLQDNKPVEKKCPHCGQTIILRLAPREMMKPSDGRSFIKDGVDIQRKGLGLDEAQINVLQLGEMVNVVVGIVQKHVTDLPTYKAIRYDLLALRKKAEQEVEEVLEAKYEITK